MAIAGAARALGIPYVIHLHGSDYDAFWNRQPAFLRHRIRGIFEHAARVIVLGQMWRDVVAAAAPAAVGRIVVIPNATEAPRLPRATSADGIHILFLGRIGARKGVPQLVEALSRMTAVPGWRATLAGDGDVEATRQAVLKLGLTSRVSITGWIDAEGVEKLLATADMLALPSFAENLPVSVVEAMAAGLAVVATPVGAVEDIVIDGESGLLVPPGDVDALAAALTRLVIDPELRTRLGATARAVHRERLSPAPFARAILASWESAVSRA
jgi:glycosyltransferase involved in cell wall biosynthesis